MAQLMDGKLRPVANSRRYISGDRMRRIAKHKHQITRLGFSPMRSISRHFFPQKPDRPAKYLQKRIRWTQRWSGLDLPAGLDEQIVNPARLLSHTLDIPGDSVA